MFRLDKYYCNDTELSTIPDSEFLSATYEDIIEDFYCLNIDFEEDIFTRDSFGNHVFKNRQKLWGLKALDSFSLLFKDIVTDCSTDSTFKTEFIFKVNKDINPELNDLRLGYNFINAETVVGVDNFSRHIFTFNIETSLGFSDTVEIRILTGNVVKRFHDVSDCLNSDGINNIVMQITESVKSLIGVSKFVFKDLFILDLAFFRLIVSKVDGKILYVGVIVPKLTWQQKPIHNYNYSILDLSKYKDTFSNLDILFGSCLFYDSDFTHYLDEAYSYIDDIRILCLKQKLSGVSSKPSSNLVIF